MGLQRLSRTSVTSSAELVNSFTHLRFHSLVVFVITLLQTITKTCRENVFKQKEKKLLEA